MATQMNPAALTGLTGVARRLVAEGALVEVEMRRALEASSKQKIPLGTFLIEHALVDSARVAQAASVEFGIPLLDAQAIDVTQVPIKLISEELINKHKALPLFKRGNRLFVGVSDPTNLRALDEIKFQSNHTVEPILISEDQLGIIIEQAFNAAGTSMRTSRSSASSTRFWSMRSNAVLRISISSRTKRRIASACAWTGCCARSPLHRSS